jgi:hypothetical protein
MKLRCNSPGLEHLKGKVIGVQAGSIHVQFAEKYYGPTSTIKIYQTQDEVNQDGALPSDGEVSSPGVGGGVRKDDLLVLEISSATRSQAYAFRSTNARGSECSL